MSYQRKRKQEYTNRLQWEAWLKSNDELVSSCGIPDRILRNKDYFAQIISFSYSPYWDENIERFKWKDIPSEGIPSFLKFAEKTMRDFDRESEKIISSTIANLKNSLINCNEKRNK